jgi:YVTN family beta-propeller protein
MDEESPMSTKEKWWSMFTRISGAMGDSPHTLLRRVLPALLITVAVAAWPAAGQPAPATPLGFPGATGSPKAYVALYNESGIAVVDTGTNQPLGFIPVPPGPHGLAVTPDGRKLYVSSDEASTVSVIDTAQDQVIASIEVGPTPSGLAVSPKGRELLAAVQGVDQVVIVDTMTDQILDRVSVHDPREIAISPDAQIAYVVSGQFQDAAIVLISLATLEVTDSIPVRQGLEAFSLGADGKRLYFTMPGEDTLHVLDPIHHKTVAEIPVGASSLHHLLATGEQSILVARQGVNDLEILDASKYNVRGTVGVGEAPNGIAITPDGRVAYVTNERSNDVSVVDLANQTVTSTISVGNTPREIVVQPTPRPAPVQPPQLGSRNPFDLQPSPVWIIQIPF